MDIELTPYGRYLLSVGRLKPAFYEFVDDDILYDVTAGGGASEEQNQAHDRITKETPKLKTLYLKTGVETDSPEGYMAATRISRPTITRPINVSIDNIREEEEYLTHNQKGVYSLGKSSLSSDKYPNFQVTMLRGQVSSSVGFLSSSVADSLQIPQIDLNLTVTATRELQNDDPSENHEFTSKIFDDGSYVKLTYEEPIIHLKEFNSFYEKENFEIEVFQVESVNFSNGQRVQKLVPLKFNIQKNFIQNDILIDGDVEMSEAEFHAQGVYQRDNMNSDFVKYFFTIVADEDISPEELCEVVEKLEINSQFLDEELICPDKRTERFSIYSTRVDPSDLEDCD